MPPYTKFNLVQNAPEWLAWRETGLGASSAPTIMGENPWQTRDNFMKQLLHPVACEPCEAMEVGHALEPVARRQYVRKTGYAVEPVCLQSTRWPWLLASLDGMTADGLHAVEIKCGTAAYNATAEAMRVPLHYRGQVQQQMAVSGLQTIDFWAWWPGLQPIGLRVRRNDAYIARLVEATKSFWDELCAERAGA